MKMDKYDVARIIFMMATQARAIASAVENLAEFWSLIDCESIGDKDVGDLLCHTFDEVENPFAFSLDEVACPLFCWSDELLGLEAKIRRGKV